MRCTDCGERAEPANGTFSCPRCGYTKKLPVRFELTGHLNVENYRPTPSTIFTDEEREQCEVLVLEGREAKSAAAANKANHPRNLPADDPRYIAWKSKPNRRGRDPEWKERVLASFTKPGTAA